METGVLKRQNCLLEIYIDVNVDKDFSILSKDDDPFLILNMAGQVAYVNDVCAELLGCSNIELLQMNLSDLFMSSALNRERTFFFKKEREKLTNFDVKMRIKPLDVNITTFPILFEQEVVGSYVVIEDITLLKRQRRILMEKQAAAGQLAAGIAHEIRNPITAIKGFLQLIKSEHHGEAMYFNVIDSEINRIEGILKELLVLAKPTKVQYQKLNIRLLLEQVLTIMESQVLLNNIWVEKRFDLKEETIYGDENQLKQVFINYIKNAIEAMPDGGVLLIECSQCPENRVLIRIIDQGKGIPLNIIDRIGEPFFTTKEHGTGLGMPVSYQIIEEHKGDINIISNTDGTCIEVNLPILC